MSNSVGVVVENSASVGIAVGLLRQIVQRVLSVWNGAALPQYAIGGKT